MFQCRKFSILNNTSCYDTSILRFKPDSVQLKGHDNEIYLTRRSRASYFNLDIAKAINYSQRLDLAMTHDHSRVKRNFLPSMI